MANLSERIVILSAVLLIVIILLSPLRILEPISIGSITMSDMLDPKRALKHGFRGYVNVSYVLETPIRTIVSPGKTINYTIQLELVPHIPEFNETIVALDPDKSSKHGVGWGETAPIFNDYIRYSPSGIIPLTSYEPVNVTMVLSVPDGMSGMSAYPRDLLGVGIMADIPVIYESGGHLDRITTDT